MEMSDEIRGPIEQYYLHLSMGAPNEAFLGEELPV